MQLAVSAQAAKEKKEDWMETIKFRWQFFRDSDLRRQFKKYSILGPSALPEDKYTKLKKLTKDMEAVYSTAKICAYNNTSKCDLSLEPGKNFQF